MSRKTTIDSIQFFLMYLISIKIKDAFYFYFYWSLLLDLNYLI